MIIGFTFPRDPLQVGRLQAVISRPCRINGQITTLGRFILSSPLVRRSHYIRHYARKKTRGEYRRLSTPAHEYTLWYLAQDGARLGEHGIDVPKIVYDALPHLAARHTEQPVSHDRPRGSLSHLSPF